MSFFPFTVVLFVSAIYIQLNDVSAQSVCGVTPQTIEDDFLRNCQNRNINSSLCTQAWAAFSGAFSGRDPTAVTANDYQPYFNLLPIPELRNKALFWSGTFAIVDIVSMMNAAGADVVSSANTDSGAIINDLGFVYWCGTQGGGIDYTNNCLCSVTDRFWDQFSLVFAEAATGIIFWLGNGERNGGAFSDTSVFSRIELPNLNAMAVQEVVALVVHREGQGESCSDITANITDSSLLTLSNRVTARSFRFDCYDIYAQATDPDQTSTIAGCVSTIVTGVQGGTRPTLHQVPCGAGDLTVSSISALLLAAAILLVLHL